MARSTASDRTRRHIGLALVALLIVTVLIGLAGLLAIEWSDHWVLAAVHSDADASRLAAAAKIAADQSKAEADRLALLLNIVLGPVATLLGSVTGFYFGRQREK